jgi:hypothetical protein
MLLFPSEELSTFPRQVHFEDAVILKTVGEVDVGLTSV